jgi:hypothetical protein
MLFSVDPDIYFPGSTLISPVVKVPSELGIFCTGHITHIVGPKEVVKQEHISAPSISGPQSRIDVDKARVLAANIGHDVPIFAPVIHKGSSRVMLNYSHSRNPRCAPARTQGQIQAPREPPN